MGSQIISLTLPAELLEQINQAAKANFASRSDYIRESVVMRLKNQHIVDKNPVNADIASEQTGNVDLWGDIC